MGVCSVLRLLVRVCPVVLGLVAGCAPLRVQPPETEPASLNAALEACCGKHQTFPTWLAEAAESSAAWVMPITRGTVLRAAHLQDQPAAQDYLLSQARPLDLILISNKSRLSGAGGEGYFGHSAFYTGDEAQLRALGVWHHPAITPYHARIRAGGLAIESLDIAVRLSDAPTLLEADAAALFRTTGISRARRQEAVIRAFSEIGRPFDNTFRLDDDAAWYCTELIWRVLPEADLPLTQSYGRQVIWPDEVATKSLLGQTKFRFVDYVWGRPGGWARGTRDLMASRIVAHWPAPE